MLASHIPAIGFVASAVLRIFAAYLLAYAVTRLTPRAAIRHAASPIQLRLIRDRTLICEVSDGSSTAPSRSARSPGPAPGVSGRGRRPWPVPPVFPTE